MRAFFSPDWATPESVSSAQSLRTGGFSAKPYDQLNLGVFSPDPQVEKNLRHFTQVAGLPHEPRFMQQTHSCKVVELGPGHASATHGFAKADACFTRTPGIVCGVLTADCVPVLVSDNTGSVVAAVHAGWRGLHGGILAKTLQAMDITPNRLSAWIGPAIGYSHYAVDAEFREKFIHKEPALAALFYRSEDHQWHADLKRIARYQLQHLGVDRIAQSPLCTHENKHLFYSHRRDSQRLGDTGRQASLIWIAP